MAVYKKTALYNKGFRFGWIQLFLESKSPKRNSKYSIDFSYFIQFLPSQLLYILLGLFLPLCSWNYRLHLFLKPRCEGFFVSGARVADGLVASHEQL